MKRPSLMRRLVTLRALLAGEDGQAAAEYSVVTLMMLTTVAGVASAPFAKAFFINLQDYIDLYFFALNLAIG